jgi:hypothetical protein
MKILGSDRCGVASLTAEGVWSVVGNNCVQVTETLPHFERRPAIKSLL